MFYVWKRFKIYKKNISVAFIGLKESSIYIYIYGIV